MPSVSTAHCSRSTGGECHRQTEAEIQLIGRRKVSVTSNPSCNFHMRNGITPVMPLRAAGVNVAMGLDDKTINDQRLGRAPDAMRIRRQTVEHSFGTPFPTFLGPADEIKAPF